MYCVLQLLKRHGHNFDDLFFIFINMPMDTNHQSIYFVLYKIKCIIDRNNFKLSEYFFQG